MRNACDKQAKPFYRERPPELRELTEANRF